MIRRRRAVLIRCVDFFSHTLCPILPARHARYIQHTARHGHALQSHTSTEGMYLSTSSLGLHMKALVATTAAWVPVMGSVHVKRLEAQVVLDRHILCRHARHADLRLATGRELRLARLASALLAVVANRDAAGARDFLEFLARDGECLLLATRPDPRHLGRPGCSRAARERGQRSPISGH